MEKVGQVTKSASALILSKLVTSALFFVLSIFVNRELGPDLAGVYVYAMTLYTLFQVVPDFGLGNIMIRDVSPDPYKVFRYLKNLVVLRALLGILSFLLLMITNVITTLIQRGQPLNSDRFWLIFVVSFCVLLEQPLSNSLSEAFVALERQVVVAYVYTLMGFMRVALSMIVILSHSGKALVLLGAVYVVTIFYSILHFALIFKRTVKRADLKSKRYGDDGEAGEAGELVPDSGPVAIDRDLWRYFIRAAWPLAVSSAGIVIYASMDVVLLSWMTSGAAGETAVGLYNSGAMYAKAFSFLVLAINMAILPSVSIVAKVRRERLGEVWENLLRYALLLIIPITVMVPVVARPVLIVQKHTYIDAWPVVWITMAAVSFSMLTSMSFAFFIVLDRQKKVTQVIGIGLVLRAILNLVLISFWEYTGAALTMLFTETIAFGVIYYLLSKYMDHRFSLWQFLGIPAAISGVLYSIAYFGHRLLIFGKVFKHKALDTIPFALLICVAITAVYAAIILSTGLISRKRLDRLNELLKVEN